MVSSSERSQLKNKQEVVERFFIQIEKTLTPVKKRIKTKPILSSRIKRLEGKKELSEKKQMRRRPEM